jgi:hypothetical protein
MPPITRSRFNSPNAMRDRRARIRAIKRREAMHEEPVRRQYTFIIKDADDNGSSSSDDETETVSSESSSEYVIESEYESESICSSSDDESEEARKSAIILLRKLLEDIEKKNEALKAAEKKAEDLKDEIDANKQTWCGFAAHFAMKSVFIGYVGFIVMKVYEYEQYKY